jgi:condensin complex subunit 3
MLTFKTIS